MNTRSNDEFIDKDLDEKVEQISQPMILDIDQPKKRRLTFKSSGIAGLLQAHLGNSLVNEIQKLTEEDQHDLLQEILDTGKSALPEIHETVINEGLEQSSSSSEVP